MGQIFLFGLFKANEMQRNRDVSPPPVDIT
jgi:hypothetical protein